MCWNLGVLAHWLLDQTFPRCWTDHVVLYTKGTYVVYVMAGARASNGTYNICLGGRDDRNSDFKNKNQKIGFLKFKSIFPVWSRSLQHLHLHPIFFASHYLKIGSFCKGSPYKFCIKNNYSLTQLYVIHSVNRIDTSVISVLLA